MTNKEKLANTVENAIDNATVPTEGLTLCPPHIEELQEKGLFVTLHDSFVTVTMEGDSETFDAQPSDEAGRLVADAVESMLEVYGESLAEAF